MTTERLNRVPVPPRHEDVAVQVDLKPCPVCRPLDPMEIARTANCPVCHGKLFVPISTAE